MSNFFKYKLDGNDCYLNLDQHANVVFVSELSSLEKTLVEFYPLHGDEYNISLDNEQVKKLKEKLEND